MTLDVGQRDVTFLPLSWEGGEKRGKLDNDPLVWMKSVPCHISKQRMVWPTSQQPLQQLTVHPEGTQDREKQDAGPRQVRCLSKE